MGSILTNLLNDWVQPAYLLVVGGVALLFLKNREFRKLGAFVAIAAIVGLLVFKGDELFGKNGTWSKKVQETVNDINIKKGGGGGDKKDPPSKEGPGN